MEPDQSIVLQHYLIAALWADMPDDDPYGTLADIAPRSVIDAKADILRFCTLASAELEAYPDSEEQLGHDIWLTRQGHGAGFWDRGYDKELGDALSAHAGAIGSRYVYRGDDGRIYID